jgi:hypothetical protein
VGGRRDANRSHARSRDAHRRCVRARRARRNDARSDCGITVTRRRSRYPRRRAHRTVQRGRRVAGSRRVRAIELTDLWRGPGGHGKRAGLGERSWWRSAPGAVSPPTQRCDQTQAAFHVGIGSHGVERTAEIVEPSLPQPRGCALHEGCRSSAGDRATIAEVQVLGAEVRRGLVVPRMDDDVDGRSRGHRAHHPRVRREQRAESGGASTVPHTALSCAVGSLTRQHRAAVGSPWVRRRDRGADPP